ncbi:MAG TPA: alpha/beta fold hydrolase [Anaerolineae bacterium]|nr:alpha/beta fold hydrolase [Anaerolineae bacterium]
MPQPKHLDPSPYAADGGPIGALLIHGLTGSAAETRPLGQYLADRGLTVRCPLLPGHGTAPADLESVRWQAWASAVRDALIELQGRCRAVFVGGLSLGSLLTLWLGSKHPEIAGLIVMAPAIKMRNPLLPVTPILRHLVKYNPLGAIGDDDLVDPDARQRAWCYDRLPMNAAAETYLLQRQVRANLAAIRQPILIFQGRHDAQLSPEAARIVYEGVRSEDKELIWLANSGHNLLVDGEREDVWDRCYTWLMKRL